MGPILRFAEGFKILPLLAPADITTTPTASQYLHTRDANWIQFLVVFGNMTSDSTDTATITVEASTAGSSNATEAAIAYNYRVSGAVATDSMGAITAAAAAGYAHPADTGDNKVVVIDVDPATLASASGLTDPQYVRVVVTPSAAIAACVVGVIALVSSRYAGNAIPSST